MQAGRISFKSKSLQISHFLIKGLTNEDDDDLYFDARHMHVTLQKQHSDKGIAVFKIITKGMGVLRFLFI